MASTIFETNNALTKKAWNEKLFRESVKDSFFSLYMGEGSDKVVHVKNELTKSQGDNITFGLRVQLQGDARVGNEKLEGFEKELPLFNDSVSLEQYRQAIRRKGRLTKQRAMFAIDEEHKTALKEWGTTFIDQLCVDKILEAPTRVVYQVSGTFTVASGGAAATTAATAMHASNTLITPKLISQARTYAKTGGMVNGVRRFMPIKPIPIKGKSYYVLLVTEDQLNDLQNNSDMMTAHREARERDIDNPIFQSADLIYNGVCIRGYEKLPNALGGAGANVNYGKGVLLGAQSLIWAWGEKEDVLMEQFDYQNEIGWAWHMLAGCKKPKFNSEDFGSLGFYTASSNITGA